MLAKDEVGQAGEDLAARFLVRAGMHILDRNWRCAEGEIDIVARDGRTLVFCEVKTRSGRGFGSPLEAVTPAKLGRMYRLATRWRAAHPEEPAVRVRVDVVGILREPERPALVDHLRGVA